MKKTATLLVSLLALPAFANNDVKLESTPQLVNNPPMLKLAIYDFSNNVRREVEGRKYSINNKNHQLCWVAFSMPFQLKNAVSEVFVSPSNTVFSVPSASVMTSEDGKTHTIKEDLPAINNEFLTRCWRFDETDPQGKYILQVQINDIHFEPQSFEVVK